NDVPTITDIANVSVNEDNATSALAFTTGDPETAAGSLNITAASSNTALVPVASIVFGGSDSNRTVTVTPVANMNGSSLITVTVKDSGADNIAGNSDDLTVSDTFTVTVNAVNDVPAFVKGSDQIINEDAGAQTVSGWATSLFRGPIDEAGQTLSFTVTNDNNALFSVQPAVTVSTTDATKADLAFTPAADANGTATVTVVLKDNGGTTGTDGQPNGGVDTSAAQTFTITVNAVNDIPSFVKGSDQIVNEDAGAQSISRECGPCQ
ncbi:MAG: hypothetical protein CVV64_17245, partial [Candidatus Wallbacteria bacterium HGW-Wallbacteria-1]